MIQNGSKIFITSIAAIVVVYYFDVFGIFGQTSSACSRPVDSLNKAFEAYAINPVQAGPDLELAQKQAELCADLITRETGFDHLVKKERFGTKYEVVIYKAVWE
jgi:hypothetical protein